jgi:hypothetical protein
MFADVLRISATWLAYFAYFPKFVYWQLWMWCRKSVPNICTYQVVIEHVPSLLHILLYYMNLAPWEVCEFIINTQYVSGGSQNWSSLHDPKESIKWYFLLKFLYFVKFFVLLTQFCGNQVDTIGTSQTKNVGGGPVGDVYVVDW